MGRQVRSDDDSAQIAHRPQAVGDAGIDAHAPLEHTRGLLGQMGFQELRETLYKNGFVTLRGDGMAKVKGGLTTAEEVFHVTAT